MQQPNTPTSWGAWRHMNYASDSKKFGSWSSNFMTEYHPRYGGNGVMIYWHVEKKNVCIYSQLKSCSSSEVAAMIEGLLRHCTDAEIESNYVDTHGASVVGFAFTELLNFRLLPRLKNIGSIRLDRPDDTPPGWPALGASLSRPVRWELIEQQYDQMVKYATALRLGTAEAEQVLRRFTRGGPKHPTYRPALLNALSHIRDGDLLTVHEVDRLGRNLLEGLIVLNDLLQRGVGVKVLEGIAAGEHTECSLILDLALALAEDRRRDITRKTKNGLEAARRRGRVGGRRPVVDDDKRAAILARRQRGESIRTIAAGVKVSIGVVHKTLADAKTITQPNK